MCEYYILCKLDANYLSAFLSKIKRGYKKSVNFSCEKKTKVYTL